MILTQLFWRFVVVSLLAFGGGQAALPLVERLAVAEAGWVSPADFSAAVAFGYITPGPVLITATFIGYRTAGFLGALSATIGVFVAPWLLATLAAWQVRRWLTRPWLKGFGRGAAPAVVGLLGVTVLHLLRSSATHWIFFGVAIGAAVLTLRTKLHPAFILVGGAFAGALAGLASL